MSGIRTTPSANAPTQNQRTVWPLDRLTKDTEDAVVGGELASVNPDAETVELRSIGASGESVTVDVSDCAIREYLFETEPAHVPLTGVETVVLDVFLRVYGTETTTASVFEPGPEPEPTVVPSVSDDGDGYEVLIA